MTCEQCTDHDGLPCYPQYGLAPHKHEWLDQYRCSTIILPKEEWPKNFEQDPDSPDHGTWWCVNCGEE